MLYHNVFADALHGIELLGVPVLHEEHLTESTFANDTDKLEIFKLHLYLCSPPLEDNLRFVPLSNLIQ
jgi:hypothetical protein